jgi:hypothetical protein
MINPQKATRVFAILALVMILAGCTTPTVVVPPTADIPKVRTEAAQTVVAKITIEAALNPTSTATEAPVAFTATTAPSPTAAAAEPSATLIPTLTSVATLKPSSGGGGGGVYPTATRRAGPDQAQFISQSPTDGHVFHPSEDFDGVWTFKNVGTSTWNTHFYYRVAEKSRGLGIAKANIYYLGKDVKPGESISLIADMVAPSTAGRYVVYMELVNDNGSTFYAFYMVVDVK